MARRLVKQLVGAVLALVVSSFLVFASLYLAPGNPITVLSGGRTLSPAAIASIRAQYHLGDPFFTRYWDWVTNALQGNFGKSLISREPVSQLIMPAMWATLDLVILATILVIVIGASLGVISALRGGKVDYSIRALTSVGLAIPPFVLAIVLISVFAVWLKWLPVEGAGSGVGGRFVHLILPAIALATGGVAYVAGVTRTAVATELGAEHVETARTRGMPERLVLRRHVLRNAMIPISTVSGVTVGTLIAGTVVVENAFGIGGLGSLLVQSVTAKDFAVVQAVSLIFVAAFIVINTLVDLLYVVIDPRLRTVNS